MSGRAKKTTVRKPGPFRQCAADPNCAWGASVKTGICAVHQCIADGTHISCSERRGEQMVLFKETA